MSNVGQAGPVHEAGLNAPYGARCFLTFPLENTRGWVVLRLNAPYGARCFLTGARLYLRTPKQITVLMHLMALGAF